MVKTFRISFSLIFLSIDFIFFLNISRIVKQRAWWTWKCGTMSWRWANSKASWQRRTPILLSCRQRLRGRRGDRGVYRISWFTFPPRKPLREKEQRRWRSGYVQNELCVEDIFNTLLCFVFFFLLIIYFHLTSWIHFNFLFSSLSICDRKLQGIGVNTFFLPLMPCWYAPTNTYVFPCTCKYFAYGLTNKLAWCNAWPFGCL